MSEKLLRRPQVEEKTGLKRSAIYAGVSGGNFPKPVKLSAGAVAWLESEIDAWIAERAAERDTANAPG